MNFCEIPYKRPNLDEYELTFVELLDKFDSAKNFDLQNEYFKKIYEHRDDFMTMYCLASIRYSIDTTNETYKVENSFFNKVVPVFENLINKFYHSLEKASYKSELINVHGEHIFNLASYKLKSFGDEIIVEKQEENELVAGYMKFLASLRIEINDDQYNITGASKFRVSPDRKLRKKASDAMQDQFAKNQKYLDNTYDSLVKLRHKEALKLGFETFVDMSYVSLRRIDYNPKMVASFREHVVKYIVPLAQKSIEKQKQRLGYQDLKTYDLGCHFLDGNPSPQGDADFIISQAKKMYEELSPETNYFINFLIDKGLMDLVNKKGKQGGGYATGLDKYKYPFIFSNFNGTSYDVKVLAHEAGHAFQKYLCYDKEISEYRRPPSETAEIHSMTMEFFTLPYMKYFFGDQTDKFKFSKVTQSISAIPYICAVDHFQHIVYENPNLSPDERANAWKELEAIYLPGSCNYDHEYLQGGRFWQKQMHIYKLPFYYIDYALAQMCAFQFWIKYQNDRGTTWSDYMNLCKAGGTLPFLEVIKIANLDSPFEGGCVKNVAQELEKYLDNIDDGKF